MNYPLAIYAFGVCTASVIVGSRLNNPRRQKRLSKIVDKHPVPPEFVYVAIAIAQLFIIATWPVLLFNISKRKLRHFGLRVWWIRHK